MKLLPVTAAVLSLGAAPATAAAAPLPVTTGAAVKAAHAPLAARGFRGGYRSRPRTAPARRYAPNRYRNRPALGRRLFRGVLQALGIAFLVNALFGWGAGGSPLGLILLVGLLVWFMTRRRRRLAYAQRW